MHPRPGPRTLSLLPLLCGVSVAEMNRPGPQDRSLVAVYVYDEAQSRRLFASADRNADDRLDIYEAGASLQTVDDIRDRTAFRRLDVDRDGFISWQEFDAHLQAVLADGGTFYLQPGRRSELEVRLVHEGNGSDQGGLSPLERMDTDHSGTVSRAEVQALLKAAGLPPNLIAQFPVLDLDRSGELSAQEALPLAALLPSKPPANGRTLPSTYRGADRDRDGALSQAELRECLRVLDPGLERWAEKVLRDADANRSGALDPPELQRADKRKR